MNSVCKQTYIVNCEASERVAAGRLRTIHGTVSYCLGTLVTFRIHSLYNINIINSGAGDYRSNLRAASPTDDTEDDWMPRLPH